MTHLETFLRRFDVLKEKPHAEPLPEFASAGTVLNGRYLPPPANKDGKIWIRTSVLIQTDAGSLYSKWRDVEAAPAWQEAITKVVLTGQKTSRWTMQAGDKIIEWDSEILADEPGKRIAWHAIGGDSDNAGEVIFEPAPGNRGTLVTVLQEFRMDKLATLWETITRRSPKQMIIENLRHFKALFETGEIPRTKGQPHGPRGTIGGIKEALYGERIPTPPGQKKAS
jgi:uncharacterized membrane protein